jgi:hypothetical protein
VPHPKKHREQAKHNEALYEELGGAKSRFPDWSLTILFYAAAHEIQAFIVQTGTTNRPSSHAERLKFLRASGIYSRLAQLYETLLDRSMETRYEGYRPTEAELLEAEALLAETRSEIAKLQSSLKPTSTTTGPDGGTDSTT